MAAHYWITANSPGEVSSWVRPTVASLKALQPEARVTLALVPCPYATGAEVRVARALPGVDRVLSPWETMRFALGKTREKGPGVVAYLGGELWHALLLGWKLGWPTVGYLVRPSVFSRWFTRVGAADGELARRLAVPLVGNLMVDALARTGADEPPLQLEPGSGPVVGLFPGSRSIHVRATLLVFLEAAQRLRQSRPDTRFVLVVSPFVDRQGLQRALAHPIDLGLPRARARLVGEALETGDGTRVTLAWGRPHEAFRHLDLALSIPGTNTAELACASIPLVVALHPAASLGGGGLMGLLERLPFGGSLKKRLRLRKHRRLRLTALPNLAAGREVAPEVVVDPELGNLMGCLLGLLDDPTARRTLGETLREVMGGPGASLRLARMMVEAGA